MSAQSPQTWRAIVAEVSRRISSRDWAPGTLIPNEADLARDFGCSRSTVNRALRALADDGVLERRRKAGTRVRDIPESHARMEIPVVRQQIEQAGDGYLYKLLGCADAAAPAAITALFDLASGAPLLHVECLHFAARRPLILEDRWIDPAVVPAVREADFGHVGANEWLVRNVPFTTGSIDLTAAAAGARDARYLDCEVGAPLIVLDRVTRAAGGGTITAVRMAHVPGYRVHLLL